jgi:hypothetical protein
MVAMIATKSFPYRGEQKQINERFEASDEDVARKLYKLKRARYADRSMKPETPAKPPISRPAASKPAKKKAKPAPGRYKTRDMTPEE